MKEVMNIHEMARYLDIHPQTLYRLVKQDEIPYFRVGKQIRFNKHYVDIEFSKAI